MWELTNDQIGRFAEQIAARDLSRPVKARYRRPLFRATPLGDKYPTVDLIVDALDRDDRPIGFFFVQVKGTASALAGGHRLSVDVATDRYNRLVRLPAPTFLIGVDIIAEDAFLIAAHRTRKTRVSSITKVHALADDAIKVKLYRELLDFWKAYRSFRHRTQFHDVHEDH